jgi:hypothetical protein
MQRNLCCVPCTHHRLALRSRAGAEISQAAAAPKKGAAPTRRRRRRRPHSSSASLCWRRAMAELSFQPPHRRTAR